MPILAITIDIIVPPNKVDLKDHVSCCHGSQKSCIKLMISVNNIIIHLLGYENDEVRLLLYFVSD